MDQTSAGTREEKKRMWENSETEEKTTEKWNKKKLNRIAAFGHSGGTAEFDQIRTNRKKKKQREN